MLLSSSSDSLLFLSFSVSQGRSGTSVNLRDLSGKALSSDTGADQALIADLGGAVRPPPLANRRGRTAFPSKLLLVVFAGKAGVEVLFDLRLHANGSMLSL